MDLNGIIGIVLCFVVLGVWGMGSVQNIPLFIDAPSVAIVIGGTFTALVAGYPGNFWKTVPGFAKMFVVARKYDIPETISLIIGFAEQARREGILALENSLEKLDDQFLKKGIQLAVDGTEKAKIEEILEAEKESIEKRHMANIAFFESMIAMGPSFGMMGTTIGLVLMLKNMSDPSMIGPAMAIALITTFYGSIVANMIGWPMVTKLKIRHTEEMEEKQVMLEGILAVQAGENPRMVQYKLSAYLKPEDRAKLEASKDKEKTGR
ncbi:MAG: MotA/TolQ/ExbB proton channel family protein [Fibromonadales bacterium]|nr:MotA/TolQ/ExbB proton channel family protein [Fibromonadales bacterium]